MTAPPFGGVVKLKKMDDKLRNLQTNLVHRGFSVLFFERPEKAISYLHDILPTDATVGLGNSVTLDETGVRDFLKAQSYCVYDASYHGEGRENVVKNSVNAEFFFTSVSAITENGELFLVDGTGNRAAAVSFTAGKVFIIVGRNKLVKGPKEAEQRIRTVCAPKNAVRRGKNSLPCAVKGFCCDCMSKDRMCCYRLRLSFSRVPERISIIIVDGDYGY